MLDGNDLLDAGYPEGPVLGHALAVVRSRPDALGDEDTLRLLDAVREEPDLYTGHDDEAIAALARAWEERTARRDARQRQSVRDEPRPYETYGAEMIDANARRQMDEAMQLPVAVAGALMPDAHLGYGLPVGGVLACENAVIPYAVGVDIACRVMMSVYPEGEGYLAEHTDEVRSALTGETKFGAGPGFPKNERRRHAVLDDPAWEATPFLRSLKDTAHEQLGTSGGGNHFIDAGLLEVGGDADRAGGLAPGRYLAVLTHSGSRGPGYQIADRYSELAEESKPHLPESHRRLAWLSLDTERGREYWDAMQLAGRFASANHHVIHERVARRLGLQPALQVENHHNFAFRETHPVDGEERELIVHRKGATPAGDGVLGLIPGSMGDVSYLVRGGGVAESLDSAAHGAGRRMSRTRAKKQISREERAAYLQRRGVELLGGGLDEAPQAYKPIDEVMAAQRDLAAPVARFHPRLVLMASD
jgi:tRNA-splicing ligase RtcB